MTALCFGTVTILLRTFVRQQASLVPRDTGSIDRELDPECFVELVDCHLGLCAHAHLCGLGLRVGVSPSTL